MKNLTRVLSLVLILTMMVSSVAFAGTFTDVEDGSAYAEATKVLSDLGIIYGYEDGTFGPEKVITRAEVVAIVNRLQGLSDAAKAAGGTTAYTDVPADEWYAGDVNLATQMGIIAGDGNGLFRPNDQVKYEEAVKMMVAACGYNQSYAMSRGGWPTGYLVIASEQGITKGMSETAGAPAFRGIVAKLAFQALTAPMMVLKTYDDTGISNYAPDKTKSLLKEKLEVTKLSGYVVANNVANLDGGNKTEEGKVNYDVTEGDDKTGLLVGKTDVAETLGLATDIYVKENADGKEEIVSYSVKAAKNNIVVIENTADIQEFVTAGANKESLWSASSKYLSVYNEDTDATNETYVLADEAKIILNGNNLGIVSDNLTRYIASFASENDFEASETTLGYVYAPVNGKVELIDKENDGKFDYIKVTSYETAIVNDAPYAKNTKIPTNAGTINLDFEKVKNAAYTITLDGEEIAVADIQKDDVLSVAKTDKYHWEILVSRATVAGQISEYDAIESIYVIDGKEYVVANLFTVADANLAGVTAGDEGTFYLDAFGNIALYDATATVSKDYGFIVAAGKYTSIGETAYEVRILGKDGVTNNYVLAENVRVTDADNTINNQSMKAIDVYTNYIENKSLFQGTTPVWTLNTGVGYNDKEGNPVADSALAANYAARMITFTANSEGKITGITVAKNDAADTKNFAFAASKTGYEYNAKTVSFEKGVGVTEDTIVFNLPITANSTKDDFAVATIASLEDEGKYDVSIFCVDEDGNAGMLVVTNDAKVLGADQHLAVALRQMVANNAEGDRVYNITFLQGGEEKTLATTTDLYNQITLNKGDLFEYSVNAAGEIDAIAFNNADKDTLEIAEVAGAGFKHYVENSNGASYVFGVVYDKTAASRIIKIGAVANDVYRHIIPENANVVIINCLKGNTASDKVAVGAFGDIQKSVFVNGAVDEGRDYAVLIKYFKDDVVDVIVYKDFLSM